MASTHHPLRLFHHYRWQELSFMLTTFLIFLLAMTQLLLTKLDPQAPLSQANIPTLHELLPALGLIATLLIANVVMSLFFHQADQLLLPLVGLLSGLGVMMATRLGPELPLLYYDPALGTKQLGWVLLGIVLCIATVFLLRHTGWLARYKYTWIALGFISLLPSVINGILSFRSANPGHDVLTLGGLQHGIQPSEFFKIFLVIFFAAYLSENREVLAQGYLRLVGLKLPPARQLGPLAFMLALALLIFLVVRELGLALLIFGLFLTMIYLSSGRLVYVSSSLLIFVIMAFISYHMFGYAQDRFATVFTNIADWNQASQQLYEKQPGGSSQVVQGIIALANGGIFGTGLGLGAPAMVPVAHEDMILTALGEEFGLIGLFAITGIYLLIIYRGFHIAIKANDPFEKLIAAGLTSSLAIQTVIICAGNLQLMPLTGIPLPFLSYGGSSILASYIIIGILLRISYTTAREQEDTA